MKQIAFYWKWWIWKSTTVSNVSAALALVWKNILQIWCDPKHDSTRWLLGWQILDPVLDIAKNLGSSFWINDIMRKGFSWIDCIEAGGPEPWVGCAGRWITLVMDILKKFWIFQHNYDYVFYDVLGDVVCWWFAVPIRQYYANEVYIVVSGEFMSLYAGNNIAKAIKTFGERWPVRLAWIIWNERNVRNERQVIENFAEKLGTKMIAYIPRDNLIQEAEINKKTVMEFTPDSELANIYKKLSEDIENNNDFIIPTPMGEQELESFYFSNMEVWK